MLDKVSVIMPYYNHKCYVADALKSIRSSCCSVEIIIVDDGSTDAGLECLYPISTGPGNYEVRIIKQQNQGTVGALERGFVEASGDYIHILNTDDRFRDSRIDSLLPKFEELGVDLIFTGVNFIDDKGKDIVSGPKVDWYRHHLGQYQETGDLFWSLYMGNFSLSSSNFFFKKSLLEALCFDRELFLSHDLDFLLRAIRYAKTGFINLPLLDYRIHSTNTALDLRSRTKLERLIMLDKIANFDIVKGHSDALRKILFYIGENNFIDF